MLEPNLFLIFVNRLNASGIRYMITGAVASIVYGEPRLTHDIDLVLELDDASAQKLVEVFPLEEFYCPPLEILKIEAKRPHRGHFNLIHHETGFKADIYLMGQDRFHHWGMSRRRQFKIAGEMIWFAPPEYVILRKLEFFREGGSEKHLNDIISMIEVSSQQIDFEELQSKVKSCALEKEWLKIQERMAT
jgi:hypothetical protein